MKTNFNFRLLFNPVKSAVGILILMIATTVSCLPVCAAKSAGSGAAKIEDHTVKLKADES